jgi:upstream activation factor subunit UAF30
MISKLPRTEVIKRIWMHIKDNSLQNPNNKKEILCDDKLEKIFKRKKIDMFQMTKVLSTVMK